MAQGNKNLGWPKKQRHATVLYNICTYLRTDWKLWATPSDFVFLIPAFQASNVERGRTVQTQQPDCSCRHA